MRCLPPLLLLAAACAACTMVVTLPSVQQRGAMNPRCLVACSAQTSAEATASAPVGTAPPAPAASARE